MRQNPAKVEDSAPLVARQNEENAKQRSMIDKLESEGKFSSKDYGAEEQPPHESGVRATKVEGKGNDRPTESPIARKKRIAEEQARQRAGGMAKSLVVPPHRRNIIPMHEIVKSEAWRIAIDLGMQAHNELRKAAAPTKLIVKSQQPRRVPYFFHEM
jgi:hypothetical protein